MADIPRPRHVAAVRELLRESPVVAILGARQVGKTTLARHVAAAVGGPVHLFDLEDRDDIAALAEPKSALAPLEGLVVLDDIHRLPGIFETLRVLADRPERETRFLVLGSAAPDLLRQSSETLAGRIAFYELPPLSLSETGAGNLDRLWLRGGFPRSFLAPNDAESARWRRDFARTFLERDLPGFGLSLPTESMARLWTMLAHWHGQILNTSELGRAFGVAHTTIRRWLDALVHTFVVRLLPPWHENLAKRQVKTPKVYVADAGIAHSLLGIETGQDLHRHPKVGATWESLGIETVTATLRARPDQCWFWSTHASAELDLLVVAGRKRLGFEFKRTTAPAVTQSMRIAMKDLRLDQLDVAHAGTRSFPLGESIRAVPLARANAILRPLPP